MTAPVFLAEGVPLERYDVGSTFVLDGAEGRHAGVVQRRGPGERIDVVDGEGLRLAGVIESVADGDVRLRVQEVSAEPAPDPVVTLVQALAKGDRDEQAIEAATETGADAVIPWQAERSIVVWRGTRAAKSQAKWLATVRTAAKQARRARVPRIAEPVTSKQLAVKVREVRDGGGVAIVLHEEATTRLDEVELPFPGAAGARDASGRGSSDGSSGDVVRRELLVVVGPEGGISETEVAGLTESGATTARLGPHVMRTSTAGPVAIAILSARLSRW